jgi:transcriptional regulator with XRE-family HTH domain
MHKLSKVIGDNVERLRKSQGLTQPEFGAKCKPVISQSRLSQIENGEKLITVKTIDQLASALGVQPFSLLMDRTMEIDDIKQLVEMVNYLPKKEQRSVRSLLDAILKNNGLL